LGLCLAVAPWVLGFDSQLAKVNAVVIGLVVLTLALWALQDYGSGPSNKAAQ
jgi:hypothetical protein